MRQTRLLLAKTRLLCGLCLALNLTHRIHLKIGEEENKGKLMHKLSCVGAQGGLAALVLDRDLRATHFDDRRSSAPASGLADLRVLGWPSGSAPGVPACCFSAAPAGPAQRCASHRCFCAATSSFAQVRQPSPRASQGAAQAVFGLISG
jgi:hypothetical protein